MTVTEYLELHSPFRFVHADHNERIDTKVKNSPDYYEVVRVRRTYHDGLYFIEVRETNKKIDGRR